MIWQEVLPIVRILVNHGCTEKKLIAGYLIEKGYKGIQPSTVSRCLREIRTSNDILAKNREINQRKLNIIDKKIVEILNGRQIVAPEFYYSKIRDKYASIEKGMNISASTVKILVSVAKQNISAWNLFFNGIAVLAKDRDILSTKKYLSTKKILDSYGIGYITPTIADVKQSLIDLYLKHRRLRREFKSFRRTCFLIDQKYLNRSEAVSYLTIKVNKNLRLSFNHELKPREIKERLSVLSSRKKINFPASYTSKSKKSVTSIYMKSQKMILELVFYPNGKNEDLEYPVYQLLNRIITTLFHQFFIDPARLSAVLKWWHCHGKTFINDLQCDLLRNGSKSESLADLKKLRLDYIKNKAAGSEAIKNYFNITSLQLNYFKSEGIAIGFLFSLVDFLTRYFLGANHFKLQKREYGFIPLYRNDDIQRNYDSYAEGIHMGSFKAVNEVRRKIMERPGNYRSRQAILRMDIIIGEFLENGIVRKLLGSSKPIAKTEGHKIASRMNELVISSGFTGNDAILTSLLLMKKAVFLSNYLEALEYLKELQTRSITTIEQEFTEIWNRYSGNYQIDESINGKNEPRNIIDKLVVFGQELLPIT